MKLEKIGVQLYTIRDFLHTEEETKISFEKLKKLGYDQVQTAGTPFSYERFGALAKESGLEIVGTHDNFDLMCNDVQKAIANHEALGTKLMGIGGFFKSEKKDYEDFIQAANLVAKNIAPYGYKFTYHNHSHEFRKLDGQLIMDLLAEGLDKDHTSFVLDTYWVQHGGADVRHWIEKLAGRIDILHLKDMAKSPDNNPPQYITEIGNGNLYWEGILETALKTGVRYFVVEQDTCPGNPFDSLKQSADYLHANFM